MSSLPSSHGACPFSGPQHLLQDIWHELTKEGTYVYACGPEGLLTGLEDAARRAGREERLVIERFTARAAAHEPDRPFTVILARSGQALTVNENESLLDVVNQAGAGVLSTCREGTCGTCEVRVLDGIPEHRDAVLGLEERLANETMMICVSRCRGRRLVLDL